MTTNRNITEADIAASMRLKAAWNDFRGREGRTQGWLADEMGFSAQGTVSNYMNGRRAIGLEVLVKMCSILKVDPAMIYPDLGAGVDSGDIAEMREFVAAFRQATPDIRRSVIVLLKASSKKDGKPGL